MNTISDSDFPWPAKVEGPVAPKTAPDRAGGGKDGAEESADGFKMFGDDGFTFLDFLDIINPLQHIPVLSSLYREWTDDTLDPGSRVLGGTLFFGPVGTVASIANVLIDDSTGKDLGEHFLAFFEEDQQQVTDSTAPPGSPENGPGKNLISPVQTAMLDSSGQLDPVTAWAMSENAYRKSVAEKFIPLSESNVPDGIPGAKPGYRPGNRKAVPDRERAALVPTLAPTLGTNLQKTPGVIQAAGALEAIRDARSTAALYAASRYGRAKPAPDQESPRIALNRPPGAIAAEGGWFTDTMLTALGKYKDGAGLAARQKPAVVDLNR